jgi:hypothetical protein
VAATAIRRCALPWQHGTQRQIAEYGRVCRMRDASPSPDRSGSSALAVFDESCAVIEVRQGRHSLTATFTGVS